MIKKIIFSHLIFTLVTCQSLDNSFLQKDILFSSIQDVFFVDPEYENIKTKSAEDRIVNYILLAEKSIEMALYTINSVEIIEALLFSHSKNIDINIIIDAEEYFSLGALHLRRGGISLVPVNYNAIMHHKFIIVDKKFVLSGTGNFTLSGLFYNDNHFIIIRDKYVIHKFLVEFQKLFFGQNKLEQNILGELFPKFLESNSSQEIEVFFSPDEGEKIVQKIKDVILSAKSTIHYMIFSFTDKEIAEVLLNVSIGSGVKVYGIHDETLSNASYDAGRFLLKNRVVSGKKDSSSFIIQIDGNRKSKYQNGHYSGGKMHCKTLIIDMYSETPILLTGSFNWSQNAKTKNNDNIMIIYNNSDVVDVISEQWHQSWKISQDY